MPVLLCAHLSDTCSLTLIHTHSFTCSDSEDEESSDEGVEPHAMTKQLPQEEIGVAEARAIAAEIGEVRVVH